MAMARSTGYKQPTTAAAAANSGAADTGVNQQLMAVLQSATGDGATANAAVATDFAGTLKHMRVTVHKFEITCQQPPITLLFAPQSYTGTVEKVEVLLDSRGEPTLDRHQERFECSPDSTGEFEVPGHMSRPGAIVFIGLHMHTASGSGYDVLQYELEVRTGTWDRGQPRDCCGRWVNGNGHAFLGIWRNGKPHTGRGAWSELMRGRGEGILAVMQGKWANGIGNGTLSTGLDAWRLGKEEEDRKPWEVKHVWDGQDAKDTTGWELFTFEGEFTGNGTPKTGKGKWMSQSRHIFEGTWQDFAGTGHITASKRAGKASWDRNDHEELPRFVGEWLEDRPWDGQGAWYDANDNLFNGSVKQGLPFTGKGSWHTYAQEDGMQVAAGDLLQGFWWKGIKLSDAYMEKIERETVKANRANEHFFDVTVQHGPLSITCIPVQQAGNFSNLDMLVSTSGVPDLSAFEYRQECSVSTGGSIHIAENDGFHPARFYVKIMASSRSGNGSNLYDFIQYLIEFKTGAWMATKRVTKDEFGRNRLQVPLENHGVWKSTDGLVYSGTFRHGVPMDGNGQWRSESGNMYEGNWENGKGSGKILGANDEFYEGEWLAGWPTHGKGVYSDAEGNTYTPDGGTWSGGSGEGSIVHTSGVEFWGTWDGQNPVEGRGKWVNSRGQTFEGNWANGEGMGMIQSDDGEVTFEGEWKNGTPFRGKGSWRDTDGSIYSGDWRNGILYGKDLSKISFGKDLSKIKVGVEDSGAARSNATADAHPKLDTVVGVKPKPGHRLVTGRRFEGEWRQGKPYTGLGMFRGQMGHVFDGTWKQGRPHEGKGAWLSDEGWLIDGEIRDGRVVQATGKWRDVMPLSNEDGISSFDGRIFEGEWKDGVPFRGKGDWWDGHNHIYKGEWASLEGTGTIVMLPLVEVTDGGEYLGKWRGGLPMSGSGLWVDLDGYVYTGSWVNALPFTGQGEWNFADNVYYGKWEDGKGAGRITGKAGSRYKGTWKGWIPWVGQGEFVDPEGHKFTGDYKNGAPSDGKGEWKSEDGHIYRGVLRGGMPWQGEGSFKDVIRNCVYEGKWADGDGQGTIYGEGNEIYHGSWKSGVPYSGKGSWRSKHMKVLEGEWDEGEGAGIIVGLTKAEQFQGAWGDGDGAPITGNGRWFSEEGYFNMYDGEWKDGRGTGRIRGPDGQKFSGDWWNLMPYKGKGMFRGPDGFDFQGVWKNGTRMWRGRKWKDNEGVATDFTLRRSRFTTGRQTAGVRALAASRAASDLAKSESRKLNEETAADKLLGRLEPQPKVLPPDSTIDEPAVPDADTQKKIDALQVARDCGALSEPDFKRARARVLGVATSNEDENTSDAESEDSEARDEARLRAASSRSRRTANPWSQDLDYCPPSLPPAGESSAQSDSGDSQASIEPTEEELQQLGILPKLATTKLAKTDRILTSASEPEPKQKPVPVPVPVPVPEPDLTPVLELPPMKASSAHEHSTVHKPAQRVARSSNQSVQHRRTPEEQQRYDEEQWEKEASSWSSSAAPQRDVDSRAGQGGNSRLQLRYLRRASHSAAQCDIASGTRAGGNCTAVDNKAAARDRKLTAGSSIYQLRAARNRIIESDPKLARSMRPIADGVQELLLSDSTGGLSTSAVQKLDASSGRRQNERNMMRRMIRGRHAATERSGQGSSDDDVAAARLKRFGSNANHTFRNGRPENGSGRWISPDGHQFSGQWRGGRVYAGSGTVSVYEGTTFSGTVEQGVPVDGEGTWMDEIGYIYTGRWRENGRGFGKIELNGTLFTGSWMAGCGPPFEGTGTYIKAEPLPAEGTTDGRLELDLSCKCEGEFRDGELWSGIGQWRSPITEILFDGEWLEGSGRGVYMRPGSSQWMPGEWFLGVVGSRAGTA